MQPKKTSHTIVNGISFRLDADEIKINFLTGMTFAISTAIMPPKETPMRIGSG